MHVVYMNVCVLSTCVLCEVYAVYAGYICGCRNMSVCDVRMYVCVCVSGFVCICMGVDVCGYVYGCGAGGGYLCTCVTVAEIMRTKASPQPLRTGPEPGLWCSVRCCGLPGPCGCLFDFP